MDAKYYNGPDEREFGPDPLNGRCSDCGAEEDQPCARAARWHALPEDQVKPMTYDEAMAEIERLRVVIVSLHVWCDERRNSAHITTLGMVQAKLLESLVRP